MEIVDRRDNPADRKGLIVAINKEFTDTERLDWLIGGLNKNGATRTLQFASAGLNEPLDRRGIDLALDKDLESSRSAKFAELQRKRKARVVLAEEIDVMEYELGVTSVRKGSSIHIHALDAKSIKDQSKILADLAHIAINTTDSRLTNGGR